MKRQIHTNKLKRISERLRPKILLILCGGGILLAVASSSGAQQTTLTWTDDTIITGQTRVKPVHFREMRRNVYNKRRLCGLGAYPWTDANIIERTTPIRAVYINELRQAVADIYNKPPARPLPLQNGTWSEPIIAGQTLIRKSHIDEIRYAIENATCCGDGLCNGPEDAANCLQDCGACSYGDWVVSPCGTGDCLPTEIQRTRSAPEGPPDCPTITECLANFDVCCDYPATWTHDTAQCGAGVCAPNQVEEVKNPLTGGCLPLKRCVDDTQNCCQYAGYVPQCGYEDVYPETTYVEVNVPSNPDCQVLFRNVQPFADQCCALTTNSTCGGTFDGVTYPSNTLITVDSSGNGCPTQITTVENAQECCGYPETSTPTCGGTYRVNGVEQTFPPTTFLEVQEPTLHTDTCDVKIVTELDRSQTDYCCGYTFYSGCGLEGFEPVSTYVEARLPSLSDPSCPIEWQVLDPLNDICCQYQYSAACGDGVTHPPSSYVETKTSLAGCPTQETVTPNSENCCSFGPWQVDQCGYTDPDGNVIYDSTYRLDYREPSNPNCVAEFANVSGPYDSTCCEYHYDNERCGGTYDVEQPDGSIVTQTFPKTTLLAGEFPKNPLCPVRQGLVINDMDPFCCKYTITHWRCGTGDPDDYPVTTYISWQEPENPACPLHYEVPKPEGCCDYKKVKDVEKQCGVVPPDYKPTTSAQVLVPGDGPLDIDPAILAQCATKYLNIIPDDPFCCDWAPTVRRCGGQPGDPYPDNTAFDFTHSQNGVCADTYTNVVEHDSLCCQYQESEDCGWTNPETGVTYPDSTLVTYRVPKADPLPSSGCPILVVGTPKDNADECCSYQIQTACGIDGYPPTTKVTKKVPTTTTNSCPEIPISQAEDLDFCCQYGEVEHECGALDEAETTMVWFQKPGLNDPKCKPKLITKKAEHPDCCKYPEKFTPQCGYGTTYPDTTRIGVKESPLGCAPLFDDNPEPNHPDCCDYPDTWSHDCGYEGQYTPNVSLDYKAPGPGKESCPVLFQNVSPNPDECCRYTTNPPQDFGCGRTYTDPDGNTTTCNYDEKLIVNFPDSGAPGANYCPPIISCEMSTECQTCTEGDALSCGTINGCPYERKCDTTTGHWETTCTLAGTTCEPSAMEDCDHTSTEGFPLKRICNECGTGWGACFCVEQDTIDCTTTDGCPGIATCSNGQWTSCVQSNAVCSPGSTQACILPSGLPGQKVCNACGDGYGACQCNPNITPPCTTTSGCTEGRLSCDPNTGDYGECQLPPDAVCTPGQEDTETSCKLGFLSVGHLKCNACGQWKCHF